MTELVILTAVLSTSFIYKPVVVWFPWVCFVVVIVEKHVDEIQTHFEKGTCLKEKAHWGMTAFQTCSSAKGRMVNVTFPPPFKQRTPFWLSGMTQTWNLRPTKLQAPILIFTTRSYLPAPRRPLPQLVLPWRPSRTFCVHRCPHRYKPLSRLVGVPLCVLGPFEILTRHVSTRSKPIFHILYSSQSELSCERNRFASCMTLHP